MGVGTGPQGEHGAGPGAGWWPVARSAEITGHPVRVEAGGTAFTAFRPGPDAPVAVVADRCPHRLVRLSHGRVVDGELQCPYHGWRFDPHGRCRLIPSAGPDAAVPPRAHLSGPWGVREEAGTLWVAPRDPATDHPAAGPPDGTAAGPPDGSAGGPADGSADQTADEPAGASTAGEPSAPEPGSSELLTNLDPSLEQAWHPVALLTELPADGGPLAVRLLGRSWTLRRTGPGAGTGGRGSGTRTGDAGTATGDVPTDRTPADGTPPDRTATDRIPADRIPVDTIPVVVVPADTIPAVTISAEPVPAGLAVRYGLVWLAPAVPREPILAVPDDADPQFAGAWLEPAHAPSPAGVLAENFLDVAHFPFVHAGTFGAAEEPLVPPFTVEVDDGGLHSVQEQWFDNPGDPGVAAGLRPVRQRRRATYTYRVPFQLLLRLEELDAGAVKTILFVLQPEDLDRTRIYTKMILHGIGGVPVPGPDVVAAEVAFEVAVLAEDLVLQQAMTVAGLPLRLRDELHVRADRSGVALRRVLRRFAGLPGQDGS